MASHARHRLADLWLRLKQRWLHLFDYGDQHEFDVQLIATRSDTPRGEDPRLIKRHGQMPPHASRPDGEDEGEEWVAGDLNTDPTS